MRRCLNYDLNIEQMYNSTLDYINGLWSKKSGVKGFFKGFTMRLIVYKSN